MNPKSLDEIANSKVRKKTLSFLAPKGLVIVATDFSFSSSSQPSPKLGC